MESYSTCFSSKERKKNCPKVIMEQISFLYKYDHLSSINQLIKI